jgi:hypothetical protein
MILIISIVLFTYSRLEHKDWYGLLVVVGALVLLITGLTITQLDVARTHENDYIKGCNNVAVYEIRKVDLQAVISAELDNYGEFETGIIDSIDPQILLNYPQLTTNTVLLEKLTTLIEINDRIYDERIGLNSTVGAAASIRNNTVTPSFIFGDFDTACGS